MDNEFKFEIREEGLSFLFMFLQLLLARLAAPKAPQVLAPDNGEVPFETNRNQPILTISFR